MSDPYHLPSLSSLNSLLPSPVGQSVPLRQLFTHRWCLTPCCSECGLQTSISGILCVGKKCRLSGHPQTERIRPFILTRSPCNSNPCEILRSVGLVPVSQTAKKLASVEYFLGLGVFSSPSHSQFSSVTQSCLTLCDPMKCSTTGLPVHHQLPEFTQTQVH